MAQVLDYNNQWNQEHPDRRKATLRRYEKSPRGKVASLLNVRRRQQRIKQAPGDGLPIAEWDRILAEHHGLCFYCGAAGKMTIEHKVPIARGGAHDSANVVPACLKCNKRKGTLTSEEFLERMKGESV